ncbi:MAG: hypothetical protein JNN08_27175 [Bryobacterales bacterium]|nr:hypothetical protein [Bryobacterales bacterium]
MTMADAFPQVDVMPAIARFAYRVQVPADWQQIPLPEEDVDFSNPALFMPLGVFMARWGAVVFSASVRPAYGDGTLADWLMYLCREQEFQIIEFMPVTVGDAHAAACVCTQDSDGGLMKIRVALFEDGGALYNLLGMAPAQIWESVAPTFEQMITSFRLAEPQGSSVPLAKW